MTTRGSWAKALLAVAVLVPVVALFAQVWRVNATDLDFAARERRGIEYLAGLGPLVAAVADAHAAAVARQPVPRDALLAAAAAVTAVDDRHGVELRTQERWSDLRGRIEELAGRSFASQAAAHAAYAEVTDLLLVLHQKVRDTAYLIRDPDADAYYLQDAAAEELAEAIVAGARLTALAVLAPGRPAADRLAAAAELATAQAAVRDPGGDLTADLQAAVDRTASASLSGSLLSRLDRYQRGAEALLVATSGSTVDIAQVAKARAEAQAAAADLSAAILTELRALIATRVAGLQRQRLLAVGALVLAAVLALLPLGLLLRGLRRPAGSGGAARPGAVRRVWRGTGERPGTGSDRPGLDWIGGSGPTQAGDGGPSPWRERSGAAR